MGSPVLALLGARYRFASGFRAGAGIGMGLTEAPGSPAIRTLVTVGYSPEPKKKTAGTPRPLDSDNDGIPDTLDKYKTEAEDYDGIQDGDGCPDADGDTDKIGDTAPDKPLTLEQVITLPAPIEFYFDTAIMRPGADVYLKQVLAVLQQHPEVLKLEIQGHTSSEGGPEYNLKLSNDRAKAVVQWLVDHGIEASRLLPRGYGLTVPLVPNDSEPNRQKNRRVQFRLLDQTPGSAPVGPGTPPATPAQPAPGTAPATPAPAGTTPAPAPAPAPAPTPAPKAAPTTPTPATTPAPKAAPTTPAPATAPKAAPTTPAPAPAPKAAPTTPVPAPAPAPKAAPTTPAPTTPAPATPAPATTPAPKAAPPTPAPATTPAPKAAPTTPAPATTPAPKAAPTTPAPATAPATTPAPKTPQPQPTKP
jgi:outer membrane protein OmpA-like peptidoglycan-associated protein